MSLEKVPEGMSQMAILEQISKLAAKMDNFQLDLTKVVHTTTELDAKLNEMVTQDQLKKGMETVTNTFKQENSSLKKSVVKLEEENEDLRDRVSKLESIIGNHSDRIDHVKYKSTKALEMVDDLEQHGRANSVRIYGIADSGKKEGPVQTLQMLLPFFYDKLGIHLDPQDIDTCHRLGPYSGTQEKPRGIICKFTRRIDKDAIIMARRKLGGSGFVIKEDLTSKRRDILSKTVSDGDEVKKAWSSKGKIVAEYHNGTIAEVKTVIQDYLVSWEKSHNVVGNVRDNKTKTKPNSNGAATSDNNPKQSYADVVQGEQRNRNEDRGRSRSFLKGRRRLHPN